MFDEYNDMLTIEELCELLNMGRNAAYYLLIYKKIKGFKIGSKWKIPKVAVEAFILESIKK